MFLFMEIKRSVLLGLATAAVLAAAAPAGAAAGGVNFGSTPEQQRAAGVEMGKEAYTYGFALNEFNLIRKADLEGAARTYSARRHHPRSRCRRRAGQPWSNAGR